MVQADITDPVRMMMMIQDQAAIIQDGVISATEKVTAGIGGPIMTYTIVMVPVNASTVMEQVGALRVFLVPIVIRPAVTENQVTASVHTVVAMVNVAAAVVPVTRRLCTYFMKPKFTGADAWCQRQREVGLKTAVGLYC